MRCRTTLTLPDFQRIGLTGPSMQPICPMFSPEERRYNLDIKSDDRGSLAEFIKQPHLGQVFVSRTRPGVTRGNHYHHSKAEKFFVVEGDGLIRMRPCEGRPGRGVFRDRQRVSGQSTFRLDSRTQLPM